MIRRFVYVLFLILAVGSAGTGNWIVFYTIDSVELTDDDFFDKVLLAGSKTKWFVMFDSPVSLFPSLHCSGAHNAGN